MVVTAIGAATTTVFLIVLGLIAAVAAGLSLVSGIAYVRLDDQGFEGPHLPTSTLGKTVGFSQRYIELGYGLSADAQAA